MTKIESSIGQSSVRGNAPRRFTVSDESADTQSAQKERQGFNTPEGRMRAAQAAAAQAAQAAPQQELSQAEVMARRAQAQFKDEQVQYRSTQDARRRVDILTGLGRKTKDVPIELEGQHVVITLRTLKTFEQTMLAQVIEQAERVQISETITVFSPTSAHRVRLEALTHSVFLIDGQDIDLVLGTYNSPYESQLEARQMLISEMDGALTEHLYSKYQELSKETQDGYAPKTAAQAEEVVDTIRKSGQDS